MAMMFSSVLPLLMSICMLYYVINIYCILNKLKVTAFSVPLISFVFVQFLSYWGVDPRMQDKASKECVQSRVKSPDVWGLFACPELAIQIRAVLSS
jgi:hypothetical protein